MSEELTKGGLPECELLRNELRSGDAINLMGNFCKCKRRTAIAYVIVCDVEPFEYRFNLTPGCGSTWRLGVSLKQLR